MDIFSEEAVVFRFNEGWVLINRALYGNARGYEIWKNYVYSNFLSNRQAAQFVQRRAEEGSEHHATVIALLIAQRMTE